MASAVHTFSTFSLPVPNEPHISTHAQNRDMRRTCACSKILDCKTHATARMEARATSRTFHEPTQREMGVICSSVVHHHCIAHTVLYTPAYVQVIRSTSGSSPWSSPSRRIGRRSISRPRPWGSAPRASTLVSPPGHDRNHSGHPSSGHPGRRRPLYRRHTRRQSRRSRCPCTPGSASRPL